MNKISEEHKLTEEELEELDIRSEKFNPIKALYSKKFKTQKKFDNFAVRILCHKNPFFY
jgi:hypothetical protein